MNNPVLISCCPKCKGIICAADPDAISENAVMRKEFYKDVADHNLSVNTIEKYDYINMNWCECKTSQP